MSEETLEQLSLVEKIDPWAALLSPKPYPHSLALWSVYNLDVVHDPEVNYIGPFEIWNTSYLRYIDEMYGGSIAAANPAVNVAI